MRMMKTPAAMTRVASDPADRKSEAAKAARRAGPRVGDIAARTNVRPIAAASEETKAVMPGATSPVGILAAGRIPAVPRAAIRPAVVRPAPIRPAIVRPAPIRPAVAHPPPIHPPVARQVAIHPPAAQAAGRKGGIRADNTRAGHPAGVVTEADSSDTTYTTAGTRPWPSTAFKTFTHAHYTKEACPTRQQWQGRPERRTRPQEIEYHE